MTDRRRARVALAAAVGAGLAAVIALILGEYPFTGATPYVAGLVVPAVIGFATAWIGGAHPGRWWAYTGVVSAAGIGWALWISTGRGVDPTPAGGWVAITLGLVVPLLWAAVRSRPHHGHGRRDHRQVTR